MAEAARRDIALNHELQVVGIANIVTGLGGSLVGYHSLRTPGECAKRS